MSELDKLKKAGKIQELIGISLFILGLIGCIITAKEFYSIGIETKISNVSLNIPLLVVIIITLLSCLSFRLFYIEKNNIYKEQNINDNQAKSNKFITQLENEINIENNNLSIQDISFNYLPEHIETIRFLVGTFFILGLAGSFSGIAEVVTKVIDVLGSMNPGVEIDVSNALSKIKAPLEPLKTVFLVTILGLINALIIENLLQVLYKKISFLEFEVSTNAKEKVRNVLKLKTQIFSNISLKLDTLVQSNNSGFKAINQSLDIYNQSLLNGLKNSGEKFIESFTVSNNKALSMQVSVMNDFKDHMKKDFQEIYSNVTNKFENLNLQILNMLGSQEKVYENTKQHLQVFFDGQNKAVLDSEKRTYKYVQNLSNKNDDLITHLKETNIEILNTQKQLAAEIKNSMITDFSDFFIKLTDKSEELKNQIIKPLQSQKKFYDVAVLQQQKLYEEQDKIAEKHQIMIDEYYKDFEGMHKYYLEEINNNINTINSGFKAVYNNIDPVIEVLNNSSSLLAKVENNLAGLGNRNENIFEKLSNYFENTESVLDKNKEYFDHLRSFLNNQNDLLDIHVKNIETLNGLSNRAEEYQRKTSMLLDYAKMNITNKSTSEVAIRS